MSLAPISADQSGFVLPSKRGRTTVWESTRGCEGCLRCVAVEVPSLGEREWRGGDDLTVRIEGATDARLLATRAVVAPIPKPGTVTGCGHCSVVLESDVCSRAASSQRDLLGKPLLGAEEGR